MSKHRIIGSVLSSLIVLNLNIIGLSATTKSNITVNIYNTLVKANNVSEDYSQTDNVTLGSVDFGKSNCKYSKTSDCYVNNKSILNEKGSFDIENLCINYVHNPSKSEVYSYSSITKKYQKINKIQAKKIISDEQINKFISLSDSALKILIDNSIISGDNNNIKIKTKLDKASLTKIKKDIAKRDSQDSMLKLDDLQYIIIIKKGKIVEKTEIGSRKFYGVDMKLKIITKIEYSKQNVKPFRMKN